MEDNDRLDEAFAFQKQGRVDEWWQHFGSLEQARQVVQSLETCDEWILNRTTLDEALSWLDWRHPHADDLNPLFDAFREGMPSYSEIAISLIEALEDLPRQQRTETIKSDRPFPVEVAVPDALARGTFPKRTYHRRCFQWALRYVTEHEDLPGIELVHGTYHGGLKHAWVELPGDIVFDGNLQRFFERESYYQVFNVRPGARYSMGDALTAMADHGHIGPWHTDH